MKHSPILIDWVIHGHPNTKRFQHNVDWISHEPSGRSIGKPATLTLWHASAACFPLLTEPVFLQVSLSPAVKTCTARSQSFCPERLPDYFHLVSGCQTQLKQEIAAHGYVAFPAAVGTAHRTNAAKHISVYSEYENRSIFLPLSFFLSLSAIFLHNNVSYNLSLLVYIILHIVSMYVHLHTSATCRDIPCQV